MANQRQKHPSQLVNRRGGRGRGLEVVVPAERTVPPFPLRNTGGRRRAREAWRAFWSAKVSAAVDLDADREALLRWMTAVDQLDRWLPMCEAQPVVKSYGREVLNPLWRRVDEAVRVIEDFEEKFGLTPRSRFRLNVTYNEAERGNAERLSRPQIPAAEKPKLEVVDLDAVGPAP